MVRTNRAAGRAHDARLARLVRDLERRRRLAAADAATRTRCCAATRSARFRNLLLDVTRDPAMLLWLSGADNAKDAPNENYAREMMELFTLGAGRGYTERDVREQARALTGFRDDVGRRHRARRLPLRPGAARRAARRSIFGKRGDVRLARRRATSASTHPAHPRFFVDEAVELLRPDAAAGRRPRARSSACTRERLRGAARWSRRSCATRRSTAARAWSSRRSSTRPGCCARSAGASTPTRGSWLLRRRRAAALLPAERRRLGRRRAGWTRRPSAAAGRSPTRCLRGSRSTQKRGHRPPDGAADAARRSSRTRCYLLGAPAIRPQTRPRSSLRARRAAARRRGLGARRLPAARRERLRAC